MKNLRILLLFVFCLITLPAFATKSEYDLYKQYCPASDCKLAGGFSKTIQKITGMNLLAAKVAESTIKKTMEDYITGDIIVNVKSFSATDASKGKFRSFEIIGKKITIYSSIFISEFYAKTTCKYIHLNIEKNPVELIEPMAIDFSAKFSEKDLNTMIKTSKYMNYFLKIKHDSNELRVLELRNPHISLKNNKFHYSILVKAPFVYPFIFNIQSDLNVYNNKVRISNLKIGSTSHMFDASLVRHFLNVLDPLWFAQLILEQNNCNILLKSVRIENGNIILLGSVFIGKTR